MNKNKKKKVKTELKMKKCRFCKMTKNLTIDHKQPLIYGGTNDLKNLQCLCKRCNGIKSDLTNGEIKRIVSWWLEIKGFKYHKRKLTPYETNTSQDT